MSMLLMRPALRRASVAEDRRALAVAVGLKVAFRGKADVPRTYCLGQLLTPTLHAASPRDFGRKRGIADIEMVIPVNRYGANDPDVWSGRA